MKNIKENIDNVALWLKEYMEKSGFKGFVLGLSGGIDSAVSLGIAVKAIGKDNIKCVALPCAIYGQQLRTEDYEDAKLVADAFGVKLDILDLSKTATIFYDLFVITNGNKARLVLPNIKARLRMTTLRALAEEYGYLVLGTTNKTEEYLGYYTKAGDGGAGVDVEPIADFFKYEIRELARELGVPEKIITKAPSAGLWFDQTDEDEIGFKYDDIDKYLTVREEITGNNENKYEPTLLKLTHDGGLSQSTPFNMIDIMPTLGKIKALRVDNALITRVENMIRAGYHKRNNPPFYKK